MHRQIYEGEETVDYAFMGDNPDAADNRWLREAWEQQVPILYFLGHRAGRYQAMVPAFIAGWDREARQARVAFGLPGESSLPAEAPQRRYALRAVQQRLHQASFRAAVITAYQGRCALSGCPSRCCSTPPTSSPTATRRSASRSFPTASRSPRSITLPSTLT